MARFSLYLVCGLVLGAVMVNAISQDPGYLLLTWGHYQVEKSVWLAPVPLALQMMQGARLHVKGTVWYGLRAGSNRVPFT